MADKKFNSEFKKYLGSKQLKKVTKTLDIVLDELTDAGVDRIKLVELSVEYSEQYNNSNPKWPDDCDRIVYVRDRLKSWYQINKKEYN